MTTHEEGVEPAAGEEGGTGLRGSARLLLLANLIPLAGVLWFGWNVRDVMLLFWLESAVVGFYNVLKMLKLGGWLALFECLFFTVHYGGFMAGHLVFIWSFFVVGQDSVEVPLLESLLAAVAVFWPALLALFVSHGLSFRDNFLRGGEYLGRTVKGQMFEPYKRIVVMHITILLGGFLLMQSANPLLPLLLLIVLKTVVDLGSHLYEHRRR